MRTNIQDDIYFYFFFIYSSLFYISTSNFMLFENDVDIFHMLYASD